MFFRIGDSFITAARAAFLLLIVFAAANYGLTRESGIIAFNWGMGGTFALWAIGHLLSLRKPHVGWIALTLCLLILLYGWSVTGLGLVQEWLEDVDEPPAWLFDFAISYGAYYPDPAVASMVRNSTLLGAFLIAIDLFAHEAWGRAVLFTLAATATGMVAFFFLQKLSGGALMLKSETGVTLLSFATFRYWGNAASFLNLLWPLLAAIAVHGGLRDTRGWSIWMAAAILVFSALYINISKAGQGLGLVGLGIFFGLVRLAIPKSRRRSSHSVSLKTVAIAGLAMVMLGIILFSAIRWDRWYSLFQNQSQNERLVAYGHFIEMLPDSGWIGFGPGSFKTAHLSYINDDPRLRLYPFWVAHQDYLQTLVEWGYAGTFLWGVLLVPATCRIFSRCIRRQKQADPHSDHSYAFTWLEKLQHFLLSLPAPSHPIIQAGALTAILLTALHSMADFPMQIESLQFYFLIWIALGWQKRPASFLPSRETAD